jgi:hypothetical protein
MRSLTSRKFQAAALGALAVCLLWVSCRLDPGGPSPAPKSSVLEPDVDQETRRAEQLEARRKVLQWSISTRLTITDELITRHLTLAEAAAGFHAVDGVKYTYTRPVTQDFPGRTEEERLCRRVIGFVRERLHERPGQQAAVARLEEDLQASRGQDGTVQLPEFRRPEDIPWFEP